MVYALIIISVFITALTLIIYLYQDHVDYLNDKIEKMQIELDVTTECLDVHKEMVEDLEGYYEKWRETVDELNKAEQTIWEYKANLAEAVKRIGEYEKELDMR